MTRRGGFTLLEVMVAVVLAGVVALLVYGSIDLGMDTRERMEARDLTTRSAVAWRGILGDALRNIRWDIDDPYRPALVVEAHTDPTGRPADRIRFVTSGGTAPLTADADWDVVVEPGGGGLVMTAIPLGVPAPSRRRVVLPGVTAFDVRIAPASNPRGWTERWAGTRSPPGAVEITYWRDADATGSSLLVAFPHGGPP